MQITALCKVCLLSGNASNANSLSLSTKRACSRFLKHGVTKRAQESDHHSLTRKIVNVMKLTALLLLVMCLQVSATGVAQTVTLTGKDIPIKKVFAAIEQQTGYMVIYNKRLLEKSKPVTLSAHNMALAEFLGISLKGQSLEFEISNKTILITPQAKRTAPVQLPLEPVSLVKAISGTVTNTEGLALIGASIKLKGSSTGTNTNESGHFTINAQSGQTLVVSYIGYMDKEVTVPAGDGPLNVILEEKISNMGEVVVVAYGSQKKASVTGAIASIQTKEIKQSPAANLAVSLAGRLPGLTSIQRSGEPGRDVTQLFIRGQGTVNAQSPIVLIDGIERDLTYIDPNEVESVTILKDASSTAIFGVRGANGVVLVTTKRGTSATPEINFTAEAGAQDFTRLISTVRSYDYAMLRNLAQTNDGLGPAYTPEQLEHFKNGDDPLHYPDTDWRGIILKNQSLQQRYNLNISGASKTMRYFVNAGYLNQGGQFRVEKGLPYDPGFSLKRYNFRSNIDVQLNKTLSAFLNVAGYLEKQNMPNPNGNADNSPALNILASMIYLPSTVPGPTTPDGDVLSSPVELLPAFGKLNRSGYIQQSRTNVLASYGMEQKLNFITDGLSVKAVISFDSKSVNNLLAQKSYAVYTQEIQPGSNGEDSAFYRLMGDTRNTPLSISGQKSYVTLSNVQGYLNYDKKFGKHDVSGLLLYQRQQTVSNEELPYNLIGYSSRIKYGYNNKYFAEFNAGYNGSEQFVKGSRFGFFPAVSAAWLASGEPFLADNKVVTLLKIRGSYGKVGNDRIGGRRFLYLDDIQVTGGGISPSLGRGQKINIALLKNEALQWEVAQKANVGIEVGLFNSLTLMVDVFTERRDNILRTRGTIPRINGFPNSVIPPVNLGIVENKGYEIELNYRKAFSKDLSLMAKVNLNYARNKQLFADEPQLPKDYAYRYRETDFRIGQLFGYIVDRFFESEEDIAKSPEQNVGRAPKPGDFKYKDLNGDGVVNEKDQAPIGYSNVPEYAFGTAFSITYKNFDLSALFQGVSNVTNFYNSYGTFPILNYIDRHNYSWTPERAAAGEKILYPRLSTTPSPSEISNTFFTIDASYLRLKNLELGYRIPATWANKIGAKGGRFYANGLNLFTWDRLPTKDLDPEMTYNLSYPILRVINFGVNVTF